MNLINTSENPVKDGVILAKFSLSRQTFFTVITISLQTVDYERGRG